jgi:hypothetical protein
MYNATQHGSIFNQVLGEMSDNFRLIRFMGCVSIIGTVGYVFLLKMEKNRFLDVLCCSNYSINFKYKYSVKKSPVPRNVEIGS